MIVVYGLKNRLDPIKAELSAAIHTCMCEVLGLPQGKKSQRFIGLASDDMYYPEGRSDAYTLIEINLIKGRKNATLKRLIHRLFRELEQRVGLAPIDLEIIIREEEPHCWGFRGKCGDEVELDYKIQR